MSKFISSLLAFALVIAFVPASFASVTSSADQAIKIKSATIETDRQRVVGEVTVCNKENESVRFILNAKNETINSLYKRRLTVAGGSCDTIELDFNKNFSEMSNTGDKITFVAKSVRGLLSYGRYSLSDTYTAVIKEGNASVANCGDKKGDDDIYSVCEGDFIYHEPSGLRIKVNQIDNVRTELYVTHIRWGGVKKIRVYKGRTKEMVSGDDDHTKVEISNLVGDGPYDYGFNLKLESL